MKITLDLPDSLSFVSGDDTYNVATSDVPETSLVRLVMYGHRAFNDSVNGTIHAEKDRPTDEQRGRKAIAGDWIDAFKAGSLGTGRGGASRLSDLERELRAIVHGMLVSSCGYKSGDATKLVSKSALPAFKIVAKDLGTDDMVIGPAWDKLVAHASSVIEKRKDGPDLSEMFKDS